MSRTAALAVALALLACAACDRVPTRVGLIGDSLTEEATGTIASWLVAGQERRIALGTRPADLPAYSIAAAEARSGSGLADLESLTQRLIALEMGDARRVDAWALTYGTNDIGRLSDLDDYGDRVDHFLLALTGCWPYEPCLARVIWLDVDLYSIPAEKLARAEQINAALADAQERWPTLDVVPATEVYAICRALYPGRCYAADRLHHDAIGREWLARAIEVRLDAGAVQ